jgi:hypothetical protein
MGENISYHTINIVWSIWNYKYTYLKMTGTVSIRASDRFFTLFFPKNGWLAAEMVQYLDDIFNAENPETKILKTLGFTVDIDSRFPPRRADHWVEVDLEKRTLATNSNVIREAVKQLAPPPDAQYQTLTLRNIYRVLDALDFTVQLIAD